MNYFKHPRTLIAEVKTRKQYKVFGSAAPLAAIAVFPFIVAAFFQYIGYIASAFFYKALSSSAAYLEVWLDEKKEGTRHATEAVLYFLTIPTIFFYNVLLSLFTVGFYFQWFFLQLTTFVATLGSIRWQPFILEASDKGENEWEVATSKTASTLYVTVLSILLLLGLLFLLIGNIADVVEFYKVGIVFFPIYALLAIFLSFMIFKKKEATLEKI